MYNNMKIEMTTAVPETRRIHITEALKEVALMQRGDLPPKNARDFLRESRNT